MTAVYYILMLFFALSAGVAFLGNDIGRGLLFLGISAVWLLVLIGRQKEAGITAEETALDEKEKHLTLRERELEIAEREKKLEERERRLNQSE